MYEVRVVVSALIAVLVGAVVGCTPDGGVRRRAVDAGPPLVDGAAPPTGCNDTTDSDGDGIADQREGSGDTDGDSVPNLADDDSDGDGATDAAEARSADPCNPMDSDFDGIPDFVDLDSDNDGLTDSEELAAGSDPTLSDSDGDGVDDLTETVAGSNPNDASSGPPDGTLYVVLPYVPPGEIGDRPVREFEFQTQLRAADVFFIVDTTGSMSGTISSVRSQLGTMIIPGVAAALGASGDARYGLAAHGDYDGGGSNQDGALTIYSNLTRDSAAVAAATSMLGPASGGGDGPESQVAAMYGLIQGFAAPIYAGSGPYGTSAGPAPAAPKMPTRVVDPMMDCPDAAASPTMPYGWGCFVEGRLPVLVVMSDANMNNGPGVTSNRYSLSSAPMYADLLAELRRREAIFVGVSVGSQSGTSQYRTVAMDTDSLAGDGSPLVFTGTQAETSALVVDALTEVIGQSRQDITTRTDPDTTETRLPVGRTTADFITAVRPVRGIPDMPTGYDSRDDTTFYNVAPSTRVVFGAEFYNDFQPGGATAQVYQATIVVLGRARSEVDSRPVYMVVPAEGAQIIY